MGVLWDWRMPFNFSDHVPGLESSVLVRVSFLPKVPVNLSYVVKQRKNLLASRIPPEYMARNGAKEVVTGWDPECLKTLPTRARQLLGLESWGGEPDVEELLRSHHVSAAAADADRDQVARKDPEEKVIAGARLAVALLPLAVLACVYIRHLSGH
eukprot:NODE_5943_length_541_cov_82.130081_g5195_i0.p1 GENE.NODE_5943_length_541_cov_82.130081_g5195_i0~~NODE_5943_length_541_cov_82.130081_g5195_i0.p1  ORF type:complete len:162 (+),score=44.50 NODE_5943_length_541_cov_82.130081_g5195_i0:23-487(+)